uniref:Angiotensin-converting enzyme n=1 Tax=Glossina brevipalpis TaxID=37001 RepID=A0A1A9WU16_9MUSC
MKILIAALLNIFIFFITPSSSTSIPRVELDLQKFIHEVNDRLAIVYNRNVLANWQNEIKGPNDLIALLQSDVSKQDIMRYIRSISPKVKHFKNQNITDENLKRQLSLIPQIDYEILSREDLEFLYAITSNLTAIDHNVKLCSFQDHNQCNLSLVPDVQSVLENSKNVQEIEYYWHERRRKTALTTKEDLQTFVDLYRKTAKLNGFSKPSDFWYRHLKEESATISDLLQNFMLELRPLYEQFHAYIRNQMRTRYGTNLILANKPYPQHLAEIFISNAYKLHGSRRYMNLPYQHLDYFINITEGLLKANITTAFENFHCVKTLFTSMGLPELEDSKIKADLNDASCWHKVWRFYNLRRVNVTYCPYVNERTFFNMFEALTDVYYYKAYENLTTLYQEEAWPYFDETLGKFFSLVAASSKFLENLKIVQSSYNNKEIRINRLFTEGLHSILYLPLFYVYDRYRIDIIDRNRDIDDNCFYWQLIENYTGVAAPVQRTKEDFDVPATLLLDFDNQYSSQIISIVLQYQLFEYFCSLTKEYVKDDDEKPLHLCDLSQKTIVGEKLRQVMSLGSSRSPKEVRKILFGNNELSMNGLLAYYKPLSDWFLEQNRRNYYEIGWGGNESKLLDLNM